MKAARKLALACIFLTTSAACSNKRSLLEKEEKGVIRPSGFCFLCKLDVSVAEKTAKTPASKDFLARIVSSALCKKSGLARIADRF